MPVDEDHAGRPPGRGASVERAHDRGWPFVVAVENTRMPMAFTDANLPNHPIIFVNDSFLTLTGYTREEIIGRDFETLLDPKAHPQRQSIVTSALSEAEAVDPEGQFLRKDGVAFCASLFVSPVRDADGRVVQHFLSLVDTTRAHEERVHLRFLLDELNHRTQNILTTVIEMARHTLRGEADPAVTRRLTDRIMALSRVQTLLRSDSSKGVGLRQLMGAVLQPPAVDVAAAHRFVLHGADVFIPNTAAVTLGMTFHELAANAVRFGAPTEPAGEVRVSWKRTRTQGSPGLTLRWAESGGPAVEASHGRGFGLRLIESGIRHGLGGTAHIAFAPSGFVCDIAIPLNATGGQP